MLINNVPLTELLDIALGPVVEKVSIPQRIAELIQEADPTERYCHVEFEPGSKPMLWRIADWRNDYGRQQRKKQLANLERQVDVLITELRITLAKKLSAQTGVAHEMLIDAASAMLATKNPIVMDTFGVDISELTAAIEAVNEFKRKK